LQVSSTSKNKKKTNNSEVEGKEKLNTNTYELPYFYISATYSESLYQVTYLFKPKIKKINNPNYIPI
jgi:hypothetical protein